MYTDYSVSITCAGYLISTEWVGGLKDNSDPQFCKETAHEARNARSLSHVACCCNSSRVKNSKTMPK
jgi:hypothetical protein